jgi:hypothetical protein
MADDDLPNAFGDVKPPESLKARTVATLESVGVLAPEGRRVPRLARSAAFLAAALIAGFLLGRVERVGASELPRYLLLLYEDSTYRDDRPVAQIVAEYARWADSLRDAGLLEVGEKLGDQSIELARARAALLSSASDAAPTGFFIIRARDASTAREIASSSPHVGHGGRLMLHPIEDTRSR